MSAKYSPAARRYARLVVVAADVIHRADPVRGLETTGIVDDQGNVGVDDRFKCGVHRLRHPVRSDDGVSALLDRLTDQLRGVHAKIVVVLRTEPGHRTALRLGDDPGIFGAALHDRPE